MQSFEVDFSFLDEEVREVVGEYYRQAVAAYQHQLHAACTVLCGGALEGVITWALIKKERESPGTVGADPTEISKWPLAKLLKESVQCKLIGTSAEAAAWAVRNFRNYIHPYNALSGSARLDAPHAVSSLAAVVEIVRSLKGRIVGEEHRVPATRTSNPFEEQSIAIESMNFCWLERNRLAACRGPRSDRDLDLLASWGVESLVRLAHRNEAEVTSDQVLKAGLADCHESVKDFTAPKMDQVNRIVAFIRKSHAQNKTVAISCGQGYGRTSTALACYLVAQGLSAKEALETVRRICNRNAETAEQRRLVEQYEQKNRSEESGAT